MSLIPGRPPLEAEDSERLSAILARRCGLSDEDVSRIRAVQQQLELRFGEAALRLGYVTQADLDAVRAMPANAPAEPRARPAPELLIAHDPFASHSERIRGLRTELLLRLHEDNGVIAVLSPMPGEGRTRLACELAIALSQLGRETLLVDSDLRRPRVDRLFGIEGEAGLAEAVTESGIANAQSVAGLPALSVLTAGARPANPLELLSDGRFGQLMQGWRRRYRHIVLDTPAASEYSDALAIASEAGQVLITVREAATPLTRLKELVGKLQATGASVQGAVYHREGS